ncbi:MAG: sugar ABC transporter substrate-binding protein [Anaerolineae bacterium]|nr:sugar ABC transporter substrate-binding protein [Anaerolineae bacterium]
MINDLRLTIGDWRLTSHAARIILLPFLFFLASCASQPPKETISFMVFGDPAEFNAYQELVAAFNGRQEAVHVELTHVPSPQEYRTRLVTEFAAGTPPDVTLMNYRRYASFAANDMLTPLGSFLAESEIISLEDFYPAATDAFMWQGELMCIPQNISSLVVYYNADLFDAAGLPYPGDRWTWAEFVQTAVSLTQDTDNDGTIDQYGLGIEPSLFRLAPFVWQNNAPIVDDDVNPTRLTLTRPPSLEALQWFTDLHNVHGVVPGRVEEASQDSESRFLAGTTAMYLNSRRGVPTYREIDTFTWDVAPLPNYKTSAGILHSDAYCLSETTANKEASWQFIEFANSVEGQTIIASSGRTVPSLIAVAESDAFLDPSQPPARAQVYLANTDALYRVPVISTWQEIENVADEEIERAFYGDITAEEAAKLAFWRTEEYFLVGETAVTR